MDPALKTALAFCVLLGGACTAWTFRRERPQAVPSETISKEQFLLRYRATLIAAGAHCEATRQSAATPSDSSPGAQQPTIVSAQDRHEPPPSLAPDYPQSGRPPSPHWGVSMQMMLPVAKTADDPPTTHLVVDGDTLAALAERYLGSADRARDIFNANRDVLSDPDLLPIGVELKLPPRAGGPATTTVRSSGDSPQKPLTPVSHGP
jgi:nucleoid-associated protein YgaU